MAILGSIFAMLGRFAGRLLNSALGWATLLLFGKVEGRKQTFLLVMALGSLAWVITLIGILWPSFATFVLAFVPIPSFVDDTWVRLAMLAMAALIPLLIGVGAVIVTDEKRRPKGGRIRAASDSPSNSRAPSAHTKKRRRVSAPPPLGACERA